MINSNDDDANDDDANAAPSGSSGKPPKGVTIADYDVGKGKTPRDTRWTPKCPSPNPKGRPETPRVGKRDLNHFLDEKVEIATPKGPKTYTKRELGYLAIANHYAKGTPWAVKLVVQIQSTVKGDKPVDPLLFDPSTTDAILRQVEEEIRANKNNESDKP
jgi:hypothetical protein